MSSEGAAAATNPGKDPAHPCLTSIHRLPQGAPAAGSILHTTTRGNVWLPACTPPRGLPPLAVGVQAGNQTLPLVVFYVAVPTPNSPPCAQQL